MMMVGHFFSSSSSNERLFIARCETALVSQTKVESGSSQKNLLANNENSKSIVHLILNENMSISAVLSK